MSEQLKADILERTLKHHVELIRSTIANLRMIIENLGYALEDNTAVFSQSRKILKSAIAELEQAKLIDSAIIAQIKEEFELLEEEILDVSEGAAVFAGLTGNGLLPRKS
ncbi:MAG: hypothetical protein PHP01_08445 [Phycisphaerae bacterium]|nr:hypothetical protein [Phycisphaerae bacterium]